MVLQTVIGTGRARPSELLQLSGQGVVYRAQVFSCFGRIDLLPNPIRIGEHDGGETGVNVPKDVTVEEPGTRLIGPEARFGSSVRPDHSDVTSERCEGVYCLGIRGSGHVESE